MSIFRRVPFFSPSPFCLPGNPKWILFPRSESFAPIIAFIQQTFFTQALSCSCILHATMPHTKRLRQWLESHFSTIKAGKECSVTVRFQEAPLVVTNPQKCDLWQCLSCNFSGRGSMRRLARHMLPSQLPPAFFDPGDSRGCTPCESPPFDAWRQLTDIGLPEFVKFRARLKPNSIGTESDHGGQG